jgi:hypothetical protein
MPRVTVIAVAALSILAVATARADDAGTTVLPEINSPPVVTASTSVSEVRLGVELILFIRVVYSPGTQVNLPATIDFGGVFEETRRENIATTNPDGSTTRDFEVGLMAFAVGELQIPPIPVTYSAKGKPAQVMTNPLSITVVSIIGDGEEKLRDIAGPVAIKRRDLTIVYIAAAIVGGLILLFAAIRIGAIVGRRRRQRRRAGGLVPTKERLPPLEHALGRLDELDESGAVDADDCKPAFLDMSEILREFLGSYYGFAAMDLTTRELTRHLTSETACMSVGELREWLEAADLVKFANYAATAADAREAMSTVRSLVEATATLAEAAESAAEEAEA